MVLEINHVSKKKRLLGLLPKKTRAYTNCGTILTDFQKFYAPNDKTDELDKLGEMIETNFSLMTNLAQNVIDANYLLEDLSETELTQLHENLINIDNIFKEKHNKN